MLLSLSAALICNDHPYIMKYQGNLYFPIFKAPHAADLGIPDRYTVDYTELKMGPGDWAVFPLIRFDPFISNKTVETYPGPPTWQNPMGTDDRGRDVFTRLLYGFRTSFTYAIGVWILSFIIGIALGLSMGFFGGKIDFVGQRLVEVFSSVPVFFLLIILISIFEPNVTWLVVISALFDWISISAYMRAEGLKLRKLDFVEAARAVGQPPWKVVFKHVFPNALTPIITFSPFTIAAGVKGIAALDYLGFGLPPPTPSWGELLNEAQKHFTIAWWLALYPSLALFSTLTLLNWVGEGLRNAFDPKQG
jgi:microcin C transport system permease protein